jgi:hypothetical protein
MAVVKILNCRIKSWHKRYGLKPLNNLTKGTLNYYKWCTKIGRKQYLAKSRIKTKKFNKNHPGNLHFRVFKCTTLKGKNVSPELLLNFKTVIENEKSTKTAMYFYKHMKGL